MKHETLTPIEQALVSVLVSAIVKEIHRGRDRNDGGGNEDASADAATPAAGGV